MSNNIVRAFAVTALIGSLGFGGAALASADTVIQPGKATGAYCAVVADDGAVTHLQSAAQCLQAQIAIDLDDRRAESEKAREDARDDRQAARSE